MSNEAYPQLTKEVTGHERVVEMETSMGSIKIKLFPEYAPKAVENFVKHAQDGYYNGLIFHRVIKDFMNSRRGSERQRNWRRKHLGQAV